MKGAFQPILIFGVFAGKRTYPPAGIIERRYSVPLRVNLKSGRPKPMENTSA